MKVGRNCYCLKWKDDMSLQRQCCVLKYCYCNSNIYVNFSKNDSITVTVTHHGHLGNFRNKWENNAHHCIADIYYLLFTIHKLYNTFNISCKSPETILFPHRAIIVRNNEAIPMSTEFTPESERQRLQYLVSHLCYCPKIIPIPLKASF